MSSARAERRRKEREAQRSAAQAVSLHKHTFRLPYVWVQDPSGFYWQRPTGVLRRCDCGVTEPPPRPSPVSNVAAAVQYMRRRYAAPAWATSDPRGVVEPRP